jgi:hypothetical protein
MGLGVIAVGTTALATAFEYAHVWRRGHAPPPVPGHVLESGRIAAQETVAVAVEGYRSGTSRENTLLNLLLSFALTFGGARATTHAIRRWGTVGPLGHMKLGERHIHHLVPGIVLAFATGLASIVGDDEYFERWLAIPFGAGAALTLDEAALLIELEDVYWTERGVVSVQLTLAAMALLASGELVRRAVTRGERRVLAAPSGTGDGARSAAGAGAGALTAGAGGSASEAAGGVHGPAGTGPR